MGNGISLETLMDPEIPQAQRDRMILEMQFNTYEAVEELKEAFKAQPELCAKQFVSKSRFNWLAMLVLTLVTCLFAAKVAL